MRRVKQTAITEAETAWTEKPLTEWKAPKERPAREVFVGILSPGDSFAIGSIESVTRSGGLAQGMVLRRSQLFQERMFENPGPRPEAMSYGVMVSFKVQGPGLEEDTLRLILRPNTKVVIR